MTLKVCLIDQETIAVEYYYHETYQSKITKVDGVYYSEKTPVELLNEACMKYGSTYAGRKQAAQSVYKHYKPAIIVRPFDICFIQTASHKNVKCLWIGDHYFDMVEIDKGVTRLIFQDDIQVDVPASPYTLKQQYWRMQTIKNYFKRQQGDL